MPWHHKLGTWANAQPGWYLAYFHPLDGPSTFVNRLVQITRYTKDHGNVVLYDRVYARNEWTNRRVHTLRFVTNEYVLIREVQVNPPLGDRGPLVKEVAGYMENQMPVISGMQRAAVGTRRDTVSAGQVFKLVKKDGTLGDKTYGAISRNGKHYSINLVSGELASTRSGDKQVKIVGSFKINQQMLLNGQRRATTRGQVKDNEMFVVKGGRNVYANLGTTAERKFISLNLGNENHAVTTKAAKRVVVIGTYTIQVDALRA